MQRADFLKEIGAKCLTYPPLANVLFTFGKVRL